MATGLVSAWKELFSAMVAKLRGQIAAEGYTRNLLERPARPYPISWKLKERVIW